MPWLSILSFLITFLLQKKNKKSTAAALLTAGAVGVGTYYLADPSNPDNLLGFGVSSEDVVNPDVPPQVSDSSDTAGNAGSSIYDSAGNLISGLGPTGVAALTGLAGGALLGGSSLWKWIAIGLGVYVVLKG